jgi:hypothetical protein
MNRWLRIGAASIVLLMLFGGSALGTAVPVSCSLSTNGASRDGSAPASMSSATESLASSECNAATSSRASSDENDSDVTIGGKPPAGAELPPPAPQPQAGQISKPDDTAAESDTGGNKGEIQPPLIFSDNFDATGDLSRWNGVRDMTPESVDVYSGNHAMRATSTGQPALATDILPAAYPDIYYRIRFKIVSQGPNSVYLLRLRTRSNDAIAGIFISSQGGLGVRNDVAGDSFTSPTVIKEGEWYEIQIRVRINGRASAIAVWLNGEPIDSLDQTVWLGTSNIGRIELGDSSGSRIFDAIFDDVAVDSSFIASDRLPDPVPGLLTVQTSPPTAGVPFELEGNTFLSDEKGVARIQVGRWSTDLRQRIKVPETELGGHLRVRLARWFHWSGDLNGVAIATLDVSVPISWSFVDLAGNPVDPKLVTSITFKSSTGVRVKFGPDLTGTQQYVQSSREVTSPDGLTTKYLYYTVEEAIVQGSNLVIKSRSKFTPQTEKAWQIPLMFYSAHFQSRDAFFGFPTGSTLKLVGPDGSIMAVPLDKNGAAFFPALPRGQYSVAVEGSGYSPPRPIAVSRDQNEELKVLSYLDMAVSASIVMLFVFGLLFFGRPKLMSPRYVFGWVADEIRRQRRRIPI